MKFLLINSIFFLSVLNSLSQLGTWHVNVPITSWSQSCTDLYRLITPEQIRNGKIQQIAEVHYLIENEKIIDELVVHNYEVDTTGIIRSGSLLCNSEFSYLEGVHGSWHICGTMHYVYDITNSLLGSYNEKISSDITFTDTIYYKSSFWEKYENKKYLSPTKSNDSIRFYSNNQPDGNYSLFELAISTENEKPIWLKSLSTPSFKLYYSYDKDLIDEIRIFKNESLIKIIEFKYLFRTEMPVELVMYQNDQYFDISFQFNPNSEDLTSYDTLGFDIIVNYILKNPDKKIGFVGHTDSTIGNIDNLTLSKLRALEVYNLFLANGIQSSQLEYMGKGDSNPIDTNGTELGRANNRRVEIWIW